MVWGRKHPAQRIYPDRGMLAVDDPRRRPRKEGSLIIDSRDDDLANPLIHKEDRV